MTHPLVADAYDLVQSTLLGDAAEHAPVGILVADDEMRYLAVNRYACELLGYERNELLELPVSDTSPFPVSLEQWDEILQHGELAGSSRVARKDGTELEITFFAGPTKVANMQVYVAFVRPATERP